MESYIPQGIAKLSPAQISRLLNGHGVRVHHGSHHKIHLSHEQHKKFRRAHAKGQATTITFDPFQKQMHGKGFFDDIGTAFTTHLINPAKEAFQNDVIKPFQNQVIAPTEHLINSVPGVMDDLGRKIKRGGTKLGRNIASQLIHKGIPMASSTLGGVAGSALGALSGNPLGAYAGEAAGSTLGGIGGEHLANYVGKQTGLGLLSHVAKALAPHAKKALIHVGKEVGKHVLSKGLEHAEQMALSHGVHPHAIQASKALAHHVASGHTITPHHLMNEVVGGALKHHPRYKKVQAMMHKIHRMHGGTALIDQPFTVRQAYDTSSNFTKDPMGTFGFGLKKKKVHRKKRMSVKALYPAGY